MIHQQFVLIGLPGSGKTTFLAAFWAAMHNGNAAGEVELGQLSGDQRYLNRIRQEWLRCQEMERTVTSDERDLSLPLRLRSTRQEFTLNVPELAGENFQKAWETREIPRKVANLLAQADGLALFVSTHHVEKPVRLDQTRAAVFGLMPQAFEEAHDGDDDGDDDKPAPVSQPWCHKMAPTQVKLVEVLQFAEQLRPLRRISVVLSAWDHVRKLDISETPEGWLKRELPLLWQYLQRNPGLLEVRIFGVSAQGGDYTEDLEGLCDMSPGLRPKAFDNKGSELDEFIAPLKWLPIPNRH